MVRYWKTRLIHAFTMTALVGVVGALACESTAHADFLSDLDPNNKNGRLRKEAENLNRQRLEAQRQVEQRARDLDRQRLEAQRRAKQLAGQQADRARELDRQRLEAQRRAEQWTRQQADQAREFDRQRLEAQRRLQAQFPPQVPNLPPFSGSGPRFPGGGRVQPPSFDPRFVMPPKMNFDPRKRFEDVGRESRVAGDNIAREGKRFAGDVSREAKVAGGNISRESKRFAGDVAREGERFGGDISREGKRFGGDISREGKRLGGDISREGKRFGGDISREGKNAVGNVVREGKHAIGDLVREGKGAGDPIHRWHRDLAQKHVIDPATREYMKRNLGQFLRTDFNPADPTDVTQINRQFGGHCVYHVNGMNTAYQDTHKGDHGDLVFEAHSEAEALSIRLGRPVRLIHNPTAGTGSDAPQVIVDRFWVPPAPQHNGTTKAVAGMLYYHAKRNEAVSIVAHSQGNFIVRNALMTLDMLGYGDWLKSRVRWVGTGFPLSDSEVVVPNRLTRLNNGNDPVNRVGQVDKVSFKDTDRRQHNFVASYVIQIRNVMLWPADNGHQEEDLKGSRYESQPPSDPRDPVVLK